MTCKVSLFLAMSVAQSVCLSLTSNPCRHRGSYMSAHILLNLLNELRKAIKCDALSAKTYDICCWFTKELSCLDSAFEHPKHSIKRKEKKISIYAKNCLSGSANVHVSHCVFNSLPAECCLLITFENSLYPD